MHNTILRQAIAVLVLGAAFCDPVLAGDHKTITDIIVQGNDYIGKEAILARVPYKIGGPLDPKLSEQAINNLYSLGYFRQIKIEAQDTSDTHVRLFVVVKEKQILERIVFKKKDKVFNEKQIREKLKLDALTTIDEETIDRIEKTIARLYKDENHHMATVTHEVEVDKENSDKVTVTFTIDEGPKSLIKYVNFVGTSPGMSRKLRTKIYSREKWLLGFMDSAGCYKAEALDMDKHVIEAFYNDRGYLMAKVAKADVAYAANKQDITITFYVKEGDQFIVDQVQAVGDQIYEEDEILPLVEFSKGQPFSRTKLMNSINKIKDLYGEKGYIYADVYPQVKPDEVTKLVNITFHVERGVKLYANKIIITGNQVTRDKIIRRQIEIVEGDLITTRKMAQSQAAVEYLSFFQRDGVKWKVHRLSDQLADIEMNVKEAKTGHFDARLIFGQDQYNPNPSVRGALTLEKANLFGLGIDIGGMVEANIHRMKKMEARLIDPHLFDSNLSGGLFVYKRWDEFDEFFGLETPPQQKVFGFNARFGLWVPEIDKRLQIIFDAGIETIGFENAIRIHNKNDNFFRHVIQQRFREGTMSWLGLEISKDTRNHQVYPSNGYRFSAATRVAPPGMNHDFTFWKAELEGSYYTPLIGEDSLVLALYSKIGHIAALSYDKPIPYKELFHIGGPSTVRGFRWGSISPAWKGATTDRGGRNDPLGGRNEFLLRAELIFPLLPDYSMKAHFFYDAGAGWNTPKGNLTEVQIKELIARDHFDLRHAVGFGLNLLKPVPAKIDWGFKLDRRKGESAHEFHLSMNTAF